MPTPLTFTTTDTQYVVKSIKTNVVNNTNNTIVIWYVTKKDPLSIPAGGNASVVGTIAKLNFGATSYYFSGPNSYTIAANQTVPVTRAGANLVMTVP